jgi:hypothetical protein
MLKGKGRTIANSVINDIATDLKVDVVHLDAHHIARIVGRHVGQNQYSNRGSVSMLGYAAAEMNGRLLQRPSPDSEHLGPRGCGPSCLRDRAQPQARSIAAGRT